MKIIIDECKDPKTCTKCIDVCPVNAIVIKPIGTKKMSSFVKKWEIKAIFKDFCNGCMKCVNICPEHCIKINF